MRDIDIAQQKYDDMEPEDDYDESDPDEFDEPDEPEEDEQAAFERSP